MRNPIHRGVFLGTMALAAALHAPAAEAAIHRAHNITAPAICEAVNAADDALLRKQPLGMKNEGWHSVTVNCSLLVDSVTRRLTILSIQTLAGTDRGALGWVSCTLLIGNAESALELPGETLGFGGAVSWSGVMRANPQDMVSVSCEIPRGASIRTLYLSQTGNGL